MTSTDLLEEAGHFAEGGAKIALVAGVTIATAYAIQLYRRGKVLDTDVPHPEHDE